MYNYPTAIVHRSFKPPFESNPIGTGPYELAEFAVSDKCILKGRTDGQLAQYWGGEVYLDEIHYLNYDAENQLPAVASGEVDAIYEFGVEQMPLAQSLDGQIVAIRTAQTIACRFQVTKRAVYRQARAAGYREGRRQYGGQEPLSSGEDGDVGENHHVAPIHPEYFALPPHRSRRGRREGAPRRGRQGGLELTIDVGNVDGPYSRRSAEAMRDQLAEAGMTLNVNVMPSCETLGDLEHDAVRRHAVDTPSARHDDALACLPDRRAVERDRHTPIRSSTKRSTRRSRARRGGAARPHGGGREDPAGRRR